MTKEKQKAAFEFMFNKMGESIYWKPGALTQSGNPEGNPPDLNLAEANSIFSTLIKKELIIAW